MPSLLRGFDRNQGAPPDLVDQYIVTCSGKNKSEAGLLYLRLCCPCVPRFLLWSSHLSLIKSDSLRAVRRLACLYGRTIECEGRVCANVGHHITKTIDSSIFIKKTEIQIPKSHWFMKSQLWFHKRAKYTPGGCCCSFFSADSTSIFATVCIMARACRRFVIASRGDSWKKQNRKVMITPSRPVSHGFVEWWFKEALTARSIC